MSRYFTRSRVEDDQGYAIHPGRPYSTIEPCSNENPPYIEVPDHEARNTGILDANGDAIWCGPRPIGFGRDGEW